MNQHKPLILIVCSMLVVASGLLIAGCNEECVDGTACLCDDGSCDFVCESDTGGNCDFECSDGAACTAECPGGNCTMVCDGAESCELDCPGDTCAVNCSDTAVCNITSCGTNCALTCGGAATCNSSCGLMEGCATVP